MIDIGERLRQTGADIGAAISGPAELRYKIAQLKQKDEEAQNENAVKASDRSFDRAYKSKSLDIQQQNADTSAYKATHTKPEKLTGPDRYAQTFNDLQQIDAQLSQVSSGLSQKVMDAHESGDPKAATDAMNQFNQFQTVVGGKVKSKIASLGDIITKNDTAGAIVKQVSSHLSTLSPEDIQNTDDAVFKTLPKQLGTSQAKIDEIRKFGAKYNAGDPLEGVPSLSEIQHKALTAGIKKDINPDELSMIMGSKAKSVDDYKSQLKEIINGKDFSPTEKDLAVDIYANLSALDVLGIDKNSLLSDVSQAKAKILGNKK